ncbi:MAG: S8/S53 family peptidase [Myxococcota bacterium]
MLTMLYPFSTSSLTIAHLLPGELESQLAVRAGEYVTMPEVQPLQVVPQAVSVATSKDIATQRDKAFRHYGGSWEGTSGQSPMSDVVQVAVIDGVSYAEAEAVCPNGVLCPQWPRLMAEAAGTVSHGVAMAGIIQQMGCPSNGSPSNCALRLMPFRALDTDVDPMTQTWQAGSTRGDVVSLSRAIISIVHQQQYMPVPTVVSVSLAIDPAHLSPMGETLLYETLGAASSMGVVVVMSAGNEHTTANTASYDVMAPASHAVSRGNGAQLTASAVDSDGALLGISKTAHGAWYAEGKDAAPFPHVALPRLFTGTSVATAVIAGAVSSQWNLNAHMRGGDLITWIEVNTSLSQRVADDPRIGTSAPTIVDAYEYMKTTFGGTGYIVQRTGAPQSSPYDIAVLAADAVRRQLPYVQPAFVPGNAPPHHPSLRVPPLPSLSTDGLLIPQPEPISCGICILSNNMVVVEQTAISGQSALTPVEVTFNSSGGSMTYSLPSSGTTAFELLPAPSAPTSGRITFQDPNTSATVSAELDIVP